MTFYTAHGDVFAWVCVLISIAVLLWSLKKQIKQFVETR